MLRRNPDREWQELEVLLESDPRKAMIRFQRAFSRSLNRLALMTAFPAFILVAITGSIWGRSALVTQVFVVLALVSCLLILIATIVTFYRNYRRGQMIKRYAAIFNSQVENDHSPGRYAAGQAWVIKQCLNEEKARFNKGS